MKIIDILPKEGKQIVQVNGYASVEQAVAEMIANNVGSVIVILDGCIEGIFTERDALRLWADHARIKDRPVMKFMSKNLVIISPDDTIENAMSIMSQKNIRHILVVDGKKFLGVLSMRNLVNSYVSNITANIQYMQKLIM